MDVEARLRTLEDKEAIRVLLAEYARCLDAGDFAGYAALFARDGELAAGLGGARGRDAIRELLERSLGIREPRASLHLVANPEIAVDGDRATSECVWAYVTNDADGYPLLLQLGHYRDELVREDGRWRFARRRIERDVGYPPYDPGVRFARVRELHDREAIWELLMEYRRTLDRRDFAGWAALFAEDGEWVGNLGRARGPAALKEMLDGTIGTVFTAEAGADFHLVANPTISVDGDRATSESTWCFVTRGDDDAPVLAMIGRYEDELVRTEAGWRFQRRVAHADVPFRKLAPA